MLAAFLGLHAVVGQGAAAHHHRRRGDGTADLRLRPDAALRRERSRALTRGDGSCRRPATADQSINVSRPRRSPGFSATRRIASSVPAT